MHRKQPLKKIKNKLKKNRLIHIYNVNLQFIKHLKIKIMKITTTHTKEILIEFPAFTKRIDGSIEEYYCIEDERHITSFTKYNKTSSYSISKSSSQYQALREGFIFIDKKEYLDNYQDLLDLLHDDMELLKLDLEDETEDEDEGYEYNPETETMN